ncbi:MAG: hypothetical protein PHN22_05085 [Candidatus ainarchaeum sp.]|nr:hypothetical protein [Candidatus ainarchaeum sp.]
MTESKFGKNYGLFLDSFLEKNTISETEDISKLIYLDLFLIRQAQWNYKIKFNRKIDSSVSDIFQDLIAYYLKNSLSNEYQVILEEKTGKLRPDILIKKNGSNHSIIEIKTTIGWDRKLIENKNYMDRIIELSTEFNVLEKRIFYIFESYANVNKGFKKVFEMKNSEDKEIFDYIFPLFKDSPAPYYINKKSKDKKAADADYKLFKAEEIENLYNQNKYTEFKQILKKITD